MFECWFQRPKTNGHHAGLYQGIDQKWMGRDMKVSLETSLVAQWVKNPPANAGNTGSVPGPGRLLILQKN